MKGLSFDFQKFPICFPASLLNKYKRIFPPLFNAAFEFHLKVITKLFGKPISYAIQQHVRTRVILSSLISEICN